MNNKLKNYFTTGEFAKLCGIKKQTLFHYDEIGLFSPALIKKNGYRYYSYRQLYTFTMISTLKELNMPLKAIKTYLDERNPEKYLDLLNQRTTEVDLVIKKLDKIRTRLTTATYNTNKALQVQPSQITISEQPPEYLLISSPLTVSSHKEFSNYMFEYLNFCKQHALSNHDAFGTLLQVKDVASGTPDCYTTLYVKTHHDQIPSVILKPGGLYAITYHKGRYETLNKTYQKLLDFTHKHHLKIGEYFYEEYLLDDFATNDPQDFITQIMVSVSY